MVEDRPTPAAADPALTGVLFISEVFSSLQGEGAQVGRPCLFIRLVGCNLACTWCDTAYTWRAGDVTPADRRRFTVGELLAVAAEHGLPLVEVTGGEPLLQPAVHDLLRLLCDQGHEVLLDTSGSQPIDTVDPRVSVLLDLKCPASGQSAAMHWPNLDLLKPGDEVKFVIADREDYDWACAVTADHDLAQRVRVVFSPVTPATLDWPAWALPRQLAAWMLADRSPATLQLQLHRVLWPTAVRGTEEGHL